MKIFTQNMKLNLYTDGGSRGNPGSAGAGVFITDRKNETVEKRYKSLGLATNNIAEYTGILLGITRCIELGATEIHAFADSKLAIEQLQWNYKVKNPELKKIHTQIQQELAKWGGEITFTHIPREQNKEADRLSNVAMDKNDAQ